MSQPTWPPPCAVCSDPVDPEDAHSLHEPGCLDNNRVPAPDCRCERLVHPDCCPEPTCTTGDTGQPGGQPASQPFGPVVASYTRADAIADGVLIDITSVGHEAGWRWPVAITRTAWDRCVAWPRSDNRQTEEMRLWGVVWQARGVVLRARDGAAEHLAFTVYVITRDACEPVGLAVHPEELHVHVGAGGNDRPVVTIMLADED